MKRFVLLLIIFLSACARASANGNSPTAKPTQMAVTPQPGTSGTPGPTDLFITQVMATKYAARTQDAAIPTLTPTPEIPAGSPDCMPGDLQTTINTNGATGRIVLEIGVTNTGSSPCFVPSWPQVELFARAGNALKITYAYVYFNANPSNLPPTQTNNPGQPVVYGLERDQSAGLALMWGNWCGGAVGGGVIIRIYLLQSGSWMDIPTDIGGGGHCDDSSFPSTIEVIGFGY